MPRERRREVRGRRRVGFAERRLGKERGGSHRSVEPYDGPGAARGHEKGKLHNDSDSTEGRGATDAPDGRGGT